MHERKTVNAITKQEGGALAPVRAFDLSPQTFEQALTFSEYLAKSEMVPKQFRGRAGDCLIAMQWGYEINLKPLQALQSIAVINGKPGIYGDAGKAILLNNGCTIEEEDIEVIRQQGVARCRITRPGRPPVERSFSVEDAKTAGIWGKEGPWRTYPYRQMAWRAFWFAARDAAADLLRGLAGIEELTDYAEKHMGAAEVVAAPPPPPQQGPDPWPDDALNAREAKCKEWAAAGKTADDAIAFFASKGTLSDAQKERVRGWMKPAEPAQTAIEPTHTPAADSAEDLPWKD